MVYMDATTVTTRTTTRPATVTMTTTTSRSTSTTRTPAATKPVVYWPRPTTMLAPVQTLGELDSGGGSPSSRGPTLRTDDCAPLLMMDVSWPRTKPGLVSRMPCPPGTIGEQISGAC